VGHLHSGDGDYGIQDPEVTLKLVEKIEEQNYSEEAIRLEHRVAEIIFLQERHGFWFDTAPPRSGSRSS
jgi:hypothetical protein